MKDALRKTVIKPISDNITEIYSKEKAIKGQKEELEAIIENISDGLYTVDKDLNITFLNRSIREYIYGYHNIKSLGDIFKYIKIYDSEGKTLTPEDMPEVKVLKGEKIRDCVYTAHRPDGIYHFSVCGNPIYDENGNVEKAIISIRDVTEKVNYHKLIKKKNDMLNAIIENIPDELLIVDENGQYIFTNKAFRTYFSINDSDTMTPEIILKKNEFYDNYGNIISFENLPSQKVARGEKYSQYRLDIKNKNGRVGHFEISGKPIYDKKGDFLAGVLVYHNINDRLRNEENKFMKAQYDILHRTIENLGLGYAIASYPDFKIEYMNSKALDNSRIYNENIKSLSSCIGKDLFEIYNYNKDEKAKIIYKLKDLIERNGRYYFLNRKHVVAGEERFCKVIFQPFPDINNKISEVIVISIDITDEIKAKNKMKEALKLQDEIFTNVTHELKTPLNVIFSTIQLMEMHFENGSFEANKEKIHNEIKIIKQNCYRFMRLINNIVDSSKIKSGFLKLNLSNKNVVEIVENIVQSISQYVKGKGINIIFDTNTEEKIIACDVSKIERIILNLISNAVKFSNSENNIYVNLLDKNDAVEISVIDNGIGIDKKHLDKIFDRFYQVDKSLSRNAEGCGIGLSLVKSFVEMHDGRISVDSEVGKGTIFKIELPSRTIEEDEISIDKVKPIDNKIEIINLEFSDVYSIV